MKTKFWEGYIMENIKDRLAHILRAKNLTASQFAELMGIQPSNVSHLLNGRNKPSLDFLTKLKELFPEYSFDWIIMGKKPITINEPNSAIFGDNNMKFDDIDDNIISEFDDLDENNNDDVNMNEEHLVANQNIVTDNGNIEKIILVYSDKSFEIIVPKK